MGYYSYLGKNAKKNLAYEIGGKLIDASPVFLCVGNSNVVGDCFGPLVGEILTNKYQIKRVFGTLKHNVTSKNLAEVYDFIKLKFPFSKIVIVDAALTQEENVGLINFLNSGCVPAHTTNFKIFGDYSLLGLTNVTGVSGLNFLKTVKFNMVLNMANFVSDAIFQSLKLINSASF